MQQGSEDPTQNEETQNKNEMEAIGVDKEIEKLKNELTQATAKASENLAGWQRAQADFINYRRRIECEKEEEKKFSNSALLLRLLPVLDDFERAEGGVPEDCADLPWVKGVRLIEKSLKNILKQQGVEPIEAAGKPFDPCLMEAVSCCPGEEGMVMGEIKKGYMINGKLLRPAAVVVGTGGDNKKNEEV